MGQGMSVEEMFRCSCTLCLFPGRNFLLDVSNGGKGRTLSSSLGAAQVEISLALVIWIRRAGKALRKNDPHPSEEIHCSACCL